MNIDRKGWTEQGNTNPHDMYEKYTQGTRGILFYMRIMRDSIFVKSYVGHILVPCVLFLRNTNKPLGCSADLLTTLAVAWYTCLCICQWGRLMQQETDRQEVCPRHIPGFGKYGSSACLHPVLCMTTYLISFPWPFAVCFKLCMINKVCDSSFFIWTVGLCFP